ncbi:class I SAM-dependent methyltransferase [Deltaproteobacteria bacterium OttesenSCG-928-M10]|nr:class I SAM-dependent methyltransferase [Deltaproteobacteria bacterium OttesenSCG-928-M10]
MSFNPNQLLNNPMAMLNPALAKPKAEEAPAAAVAPPPFDPDMYVNAYGRLGLLAIENVADLGCGAGNFVSVMAARNQRPEMYVGIDSSHAQISMAKAAYPGWKFIYGDFNDERIRAEYERYGAFLMLNLIDEMEDDIGFFLSLPEGKPLVFSMPRFEKEGSLHWMPEGRDIHERYSSILQIKSIGRFRNKNGEAWSLVLANRW